jgi:hypothetical protein
VYSNCNVKVWYGYIYTCTCRSDKADQSLRITDLTRQSGDGALSGTWRVLEEIVEHWVWTESRAHPSCAGVFGEGHFVVSCEL